MSSITVSDLWFFPEGKRDDSVVSLGFLLFHGVTASTTEVRPLAEFLHAQFPGSVIHAPLLPGHGTQVSDLHRLKWEDMAKAARDAFSALKARASRVIVLGVSMGGTLAYYVAHEFQGRDKGVIAVASLGTPYALGWKQRFLIKLAGLLGLKTIKKSPEAKQYFEQHHLFSYMAHSVPYLNSYLDSLKHLKSLYSSIRVPASIHHGLRDELVPPREALKLASALRETSFHEIIYYKNSGHILTVEPDHDLVFTNLHSFLRHVLRS